MKKGMQIQMSDNIKLRVKFQKTGAIRYIGHLDVMRFFQKCIRRAEIDVSFTGGFSPHQIMSFASPLSVGLESLGEYMDIEVNSVTSSEDMIQRLNAASVPGIKIVSVKRLPENAGNAMASVAAARYRVRFREDRVPKLFLEENQKIHQAIEHFLALPEILYTKEGKKGQREINLRQGIYEFYWNAEEKTCEMLLDASSAGNIKPVQVLEALLSLQQQELPSNSLLILRLETYTNIGSEEEPNLVSMDSIGEIFREA